MTWGIRSVSYKEVFFVLKIDNEPFSPNVDLTSHFILSACCLNSRDHTSLDYPFVGQKPNMALLIFLEVMEHLIF